MNTTTAPPRTSIDDELASRLLEQRIIVLGAELDEANGNRLCTQLLLLSAEDPRRDISLWINSPGGSVPAMLAIMDVMRLIPNDVSTLAMGLACSAGQFLLSAGTPGKRYALPHARILLHQGSAGIGGTAVDIEIQAEDLRHTRDTVLGLIAEHTGQPLERIVPTPSGTAGSPPRRPSPTASWTGSSPGSTTCGPAPPPRPPRGWGMSGYAVPYVVERTPRGERSMDVFSRLLVGADRLPRHRDRRRRRQRR